MPVRSTTRPWLMRSHLAVVNRLLAVSGVDATAQDNSAAIRAAMRGHLAVVDRLLAVPGVDAAAQNNQALIEAARGGHVALVQRLLAVPNVDVAAQNNQAIVDAANTVVDLLLDHPGVDPSAQDNQVLINASASGDVVLVDRLLAWPGVNVTAQNHQAIVEAAYHGHADVLARLLAVPGLDLSDCRRELLVRHILCRQDVVDVLATVSGIDVTAAVNWMISGEGNGDVVVERWLANPGAAVYFELDPHSSSQPMERHLAAVRLCLESHPVKTCQQLAVVYRLAYVVAQPEMLPVCMGELVCGAVLSLGLAQFTVGVHRQLRTWLHMLRKHANNNVVRFE